MSTASAYRLRARFDAQPFRLAWDAALDFAIRRLGDAVFARALNGTPVPHYYQGEQVGEHRRYDNRLAMFLLRYRDPLRYAATLDQMVYSGDPEIAAVRLARHAARVATGDPDCDPAAAHLALPWSSAHLPTPAELRAAADRAHQAAAEEAEADREALQDAADRRLETMRLRLLAAVAAQEERPASPDPLSGRGEPRVTWR